MKCWEVDGVELPLRGKTVERPQKATYIQMKDLGYIVHSLRQFENAKPHWEMQSTNEIQSRENKFQVEQ